MRFSYNLKSYHVQLNYTKRQKQKANAESAIKQNNKELGVHVTHTLFKTEISPSYKETKTYHVVFYLDLYILAIGQTIVCRENR